MTKEQEESIEILEGMVKSYIEADECGLSNNDFKHEIRAMQTVLSMLKEKSAEIEQKNTELAEKNAEIEKKDKIIDGMTKYINYLSDELVKATGKNELEFCNGNKCCKDSNYSCEQCIKEYLMILKR